MECSHEYAGSPAPTILQLVSAIEPWVAVLAVDDPNAPGGVRIFTRRIACWALMQQPGDIVRLSGLCAQEEEAGEMAAEMIACHSSLGVLGYAPADEVQDLPSDRTDWLDLARQWPSMRRAAIAQCHNAPARERVAV